MNRRQDILDTISDNINDFLYYDRKEDYDLPVGAIDLAITNGDITIDEIVNHFETELRKNLG